MSETDREKWNTRYRAGAYATRWHASELLVQWLPRLKLPAARPRALDIACGAGRNSLYLAREGWQVDAVDISDVALEQLAGRADADGLLIRCINWDLEQALRPLSDVLQAQCYDLAIMFRYADAALVEPMAAALQPGGYLMVESHLVTDADVIGPGGASHRVAQGELAAAADAAGLEVLLCTEGLVQDPDGRPAALARLVGRKPVK